MHAMTQDVIMYQFHDMCLGITPDRVGSDCSPRFWCSGGLGRTYLGISSELFRGTSGLPGGHPRSFSTDPRLLTSLATYEPSPEANEGFGWGGRAQFDFGTPT